MDNTSTATSVATKTRQQYLYNQLKSKTKEAEGFYTNPHGVTFMEHKKAKMFEATIIINVDDRVFEYGNLKVGLSIHQQQFEKMNVDNINHSWIVKKANKVGFRAWNQYFFFKIDNGNEEREEPKTLVKFEYGEEGSISFARQQIELENTFMTVQQAVAYTDDQFREVHHKQSSDSIFNN